MVGNIEIRLHRTVLYNSIYCAQAPVFCLRDTVDGEMAALYLDSFERVRAGAEPLADRI